MKDYDYPEYIKHIEEKDPMAAVHTISDLVNGIKYYTQALRITGMSCAEDIDDLLNEIKAYAKDASIGISRETNERYRDAQQSTANMINGILVMSGMLQDEEK